MIAYTPETMTLRQYSRFEKSKNARHLFRVWVPMWYANKHAQPFVQSFSLLFNSKAQDELDKEMMRLLAVNKIMLLQALILAIQVHLGEKIQLEMMKPGFKYLKEDPKLIEYIKIIDETCGIKVETLEDIITLKGELERKIDKYDELYAPKGDAKQGISMIQLAFSVFSLMNMPFDGNITLSEFAELKTLADEKAKAMQEQINKSNG